jgi:hypothetical protein
MKIIPIICAVSLFSTGMFAQNKNVKDETKTTVTTVKTSEGEKKYVTKENVKEVQNIELKDAQPNTINVETKDSPVNVTTTTRITNPDGSVRTVDIDRSSYYSSNGQKYKVTSDPQGYSVYAEGKKPALLRKTSTNSYIFRANDKTSLGFFDSEGNLVVEIYDDKSDTITTEKYILVKE